MQQLMDEEKPSSGHQRAETRDFAELLTDGVGELLGVSPETLRVWRTSMQDTAPDSFLRLLESRDAEEHRK
jgi:hypothetical protein